MEEVTPTFYASGTHALNFTFKGRGFSNVPSDAVVITSFQNNTPLMYRYETDNVSVLPVTIVDDNTLTAVGGEHEYGTRRYPGAILSNDRETIYWVNNTRPLP